MRAERCDPRFACSRCGQRVTRQGEQNSSVMDAIYLLIAKKPPWKSSAMLVLHAITNRVLPAYPHRTLPQQCCGEFLRRGSFWD
jgi:hypothetical protein